MIRLLARHSYRWNPDDDSKQVWIYDVVRHGRQPGGGQCPGTVRTIPGREIRWIYRPPSEADPPEAWL